MDLFEESQDDSGREYVARGVTREQLRAGVSTFKDGWKEHPTLEDRVLATYAAMRANDRKASYVGAPAIFALMKECQSLYEAFGDFGPYHVGSSLHKPDWRDVDIRYMLPDKVFWHLFPDATVGGWEGDPRWQWMCVSIAERLTKLTGLPVDFQFQWASHANALHKGERHALFIKQKRRDDEDATYGT